MRSSVGGNINCTFRSAIVSCLRWAFLLLATSLWAQIPQIVEIPDSVGNPPLQELRTRRLDLVNRRADLRQQAASHNGQCSSVMEGTAAEQACSVRRKRLESAIASYSSKVREFNADVAQATSAATDPAVRSYRPSGSALIGGTTWIVGYNVQKADPKLVAKEREMMAQQMKLAGLPYSDGIDFKRYNFVLGIGASTDPYIDLGTRVVFDEFKNGQFSAEEQKAYDSLKDRQFNELACHSNGAMVCLAALENKAVIADRVVLYGPQVTIESLGMWDELVRSGRVKSVQVFINQSDPVPSVSLLGGGGFLGATALSTMAMFKLPTIARVINETSPRLSVRTFSCGNGAPTIECHAMKAYAARVNYKPDQSQQTVPGTKLHGVGVNEPPSP